MYYSHFENDMHSSLRGWHQQISSGDDGLGVEQF